jgi:hypothetical protein
MYRTDRTDRQRLARLWIVQEDRPCAICGSRDRRQIAHLENYHQCQETHEGNTRVLCYTCHKAEHPNSKFKVGDIIRINGRTPAAVDLVRGRPRTIVAVRYDQTHQCNYYLVGSNGRGETADGQPLEGYRPYEFRSYMLVAYQPRKYGKRKYRMSQTDSRRVN